MTLNLSSQIVSICSQVVEDTSDGCGAKFAAIVVSEQFEGKPLLQRHRYLHLD